MELHSIEKLSDDVINKIAAGEVVDRPASIVRELIDNALDAGAKKISVQIAGGGISYIQVTDDGSGMSASDVQRSVERHATSKVRSIEDLLSLGTRGFRGEALASIGAVAALTISSKSADQPIGHRISVSHGEVSAITPCSMGQGTVVEIRDLFLQVPARRKFLKTERTESLKCREVLQALAMANPATSMVFTADGKELVRFASCSSVVARAKQFFNQRGVEVGKYQFDGDISVEGFLVTPDESHRGTSAELFLIVNNRVVQDKMLSRAVRDGCGAMLRDGFAPSGAICITMPQAELDVNVHPQKSEVRFAQPQALYLAVRSAVSRALSALAGRRDPLIDRASASGLSAAAGEFSRPTNVVGTAVGYTATPLRDNASVAHPELAYQQVAGGQGDTLPYTQTGPVRYVGQLFGYVLLFEIAEGVLLMDMHAAHERLTYNAVLEKLLKQHAQVPQQMLLLPEPVLLSTREQQLVEDHRELLLRAGYSLRGAAAEVVITGIPAFVRIEMAKTVLQELLQTFIDTDATSTTGAALERCLERMAARLACHASYRSGDIIKEQEAMELLARVDAATACPHGRPVMRVITLDDLTAPFARGV